MGPAVPAVARLRGVARSSSLAWEPLALPCEPLAERGRDKARSAIASAARDRLAARGVKASPKPSQEWVRITKSEYLKDPAGLKARHRHLRIVPDEPVRLGIERHSSGWSTIRVFVSSTFKDMHGERDHLTRQVFPELNEKAKRRKVRVLPVDLRWGLTKEDTAEGGLGALELCLEEIDRCSKWIIVLGGERFGWIPDTYKVSNNPKWDWLRSFDRGYSITALEVQHGILNHPDEPVHAFVYIRSPAFMQKCELAYRDIFLDENRARQAALMEQCRRHKYATVMDGYECSFGHVTRNGEGKAIAGHTTDLGAWGEQVLEDLWAAISDEFPEVSAEMNTRQMERSYHELVVAQRSRNFIGREEMLRQLEEFVGPPRCTPEPGLLLVYGQHGSGKTALLAKFASTLREKRDSAASFALFHFIGASPASLTIRRTLQRLCDELSHHFGIKGEIPGVEEYEALKRAFGAFLHEASSRCPADEPLVLVVDAANQLEAVDRAHMLDWIPQPLPPRCRVVVSTVDVGDDGGAHPIVASLRQRLDAPRELLIGALENALQKALIERTLSEYHKALDREQLKLLLKKQAALNPLYLMVICEEVRVFGMFEDVTDHIRKLPDTIPEMFLKVLERLEAEHQRELVERALCLVSVSKNGLMENELLELLARKDEVQLPRAYWARLFRSLEFYLRPPGESGEGTIAFYFNQLGEAVQERYLATAARERHFHRMLAEYLRIKARFLRSDADMRFRICVLIFQAVNKLRRPLIRAGRPVVPLRRISERSTLARLLSQETPVRVLELLPYHLLKAREWGMLTLVLTNLRFVEEKCRAGMTFELVADYLRLQAALRAAPEVVPASGRAVDEGGEDADGGELPDEQGRARLLDFQRFIQRSSHVLARDPALTFQMAMNQPDASAPHEHAASRLRLGVVEFPFLRHLNKPQTVDGCVMTITAHRHFVWALAVSQGTDEHRQFFATACWDGSVKLFDAMNGMEVATLSGHRANARCVAFSPDGRFVASGGGDWRLHVHDTIAGSEVMAAEGHTDVVWAVAFAPDGRRLVSAGEDRVLRVWDVALRRELAVLRGHTEWVRAADWSPDGALIASAADDESLKIWTGKAHGDYGLVVTLAGHSNVVRGCAFSPNSAYLASASGDRTVKLWDCATFACAKTFRGHEGVVHCVRWSRDGARLVSSSLDCTVRVWDVRTRACLATLSGHLGNVRSCAFLNDDVTVVSASDDGLVKLWDPTSSREYERLGAGGEDGADEADDLIACVQTLTGHTTFVWSLAVSPDGTRCITTCWDGTARVWDVLQGKPIPCDIRQSRNIRCCAWAPRTHRHPNGAFVATGSGDATVKIWETKGYREIAHLRGHADVVWGVAVSPNAAKLVSASEDRTLKIWDTSSWTEIGVLLGHHDWVRCVSFSPDGDFLISGADDETVKVWDVYLCQEVRTLKGHRGVIRCATYSGAKGEYILTASGDKTVKMWNAANGACVATLQGHTRIVNHVEASPDGKYIATASGDGEVRVYDHKTGVCVQTLTGHSRDVHQARFAYIGAPPFTHKLLVSCSDDGSVKVWDVARVEEWHARNEAELEAPTNGTLDEVGVQADAAALPLGRCLLTIGDADPKSRGPPRGRHTSFVWCIAVLPDGARICTAGWDGKLVLWDAATGALVREFAGHAANVRGCAFAPDGSFVASSGGDRRLKLWRLSTGELLADVHAHDDVVWGVAVSPDSALVATASEDRTLRVWGLDGKLRETLKGHTEWVRAAAFSPDGRFLASASDDETVKVWDCHTWQLITTLSGHSGPVRGVCFAPNSQCLVSCSADRSLKAYDVSRWSLIKTFRGHDAIVHSVAFSADGSSLSSSSLDQRVKVWDFATRACVATLVGHVGNVRSCAFLGDSPSRIVSGGDDSTARVWDVAECRASAPPPAAGHDGDDPEADVDYSIRTLTGHTHFVWSVAVSADAKRILTTCWDATAKVWDAETGAEIPTNIRHEKNVRCCAWAGATAEDPRGPFFATGSGDATVKVWRSGDAGLAAHLRGHEDVVWGVAFAPDAAQLASASEDRTVRTWSTRTWQVLLTLQGHLDWCRSVAFSPSGAQILSSSDDETLKVWDARSGSEIATLHSHAGVLRCGVFNPSGSAIVSASGDKRVKMWDSATGRCVMTMRGHSKIVNWAEFSPDGKHIVSAGGDGLVVVWDAYTCEKLAELRGHARDVHAARFLGPDRIVSVSDDKTVKIWDFRRAVEAAAAAAAAAAGPAAGETPRPRGRSERQLRAPRGESADSNESRRTSRTDQTGGTGTDLTGDDTASLAGTDFGGVDPSEGGGRRRRRRDRHRSAVVCIKWAPDGEWLVSGSRDRTLRVWGRDGAHRATLRGHGGVVRSVSVAPDGRRIASGSWDRTVMFWGQDEEGAWEQVGSVAGHTGIVHSVAYSPDGRLLASGSEDCTARVWRLAGEELEAGAPCASEVAVLSGHAPNVARVLWAAGGHRLLAVCGTSLKLFDVAAGFREVAAARLHEAPVRSVAVDDASRRLLAVAGGGSCRAFDLDTLARLAEFKVCALGGREGPAAAAAVACAFFGPSPDALAGLSCSDDADALPRYAVAAEASKLVATYTESGRQLCAFEGRGAFACLDARFPRLAAGDSRGNVYVLENYIPELQWGPAPRSPGPLATQAV